MFYVKTANNLKTIQMNKKIVTEEYLRKFIQSHK